MRTTCRIFLASILLMAVVGIASAQDNGAPPPSAAPVPVATPVPAVPPSPGDQSAAPGPVVTAVPDLPPIPGSQSDAPAVEPAVPASPSTPPLVQPEPPVEPVAVPAVNPPALEKQPVSVVTGKRVTKKKQVEKPATHEADSTGAAGAAVSAAAVDKTGNTPPPPGAAASTAAAASSAPQPAPAAEASAVENPEETASKREMGIGGWILFALAVIALFGTITLFRRRRSRNRSRTSIVDHETLTPEPQPISLLSQELKPSLVPRP